MSLVDSLVRQALQLLVKTKMDLKAKNLENSTALDIAANAEIKKILTGVGAKRGSCVTDAPTLADRLRSKLTIMHKILIFIFRVRKDISEDQRNAFLVVAALVATTTFQSAISPPGGVYQVDAGYNNVNTNSLNSTANATQGNAGKSVISKGDLFILSILDTLSFLVSTMSTFILTPKRMVGSILFGPVFWFACSYLYYMVVISPTSAASVFNSIVLCLFSFLDPVMYWTLAVVYKRFQGHTKKREIKTNYSTGRNRW